MSLDYRSELQTLVPGLDVNRYYDAWRLLLLLWRDVWMHSSADWGRYRANIWTMFTERVQSAARTAGDLDGFLSRFSRLMSLAGLGSNQDDRAELARMLALPTAERRVIMRMLRDDAPVLVALVRRWKDVHGQAFRYAESEVDTEDKEGLWQLQ